MNSNAIFKSRKLRYQPILTWCRHFTVYTLNSIRTFDNSKLFLTFWRIQLTSLSAIKPSIYKYILYILLTVHHVMILGKWLTWRTNFYVFIYIFNSLRVSSTSCSSSGETNCVNTTSGSCHSVSVAVSYAGRKSDLHTTQPPTATRSCIDTICLSWWWARCARNM